MKWPFSGYLLTKFLCGSSISLFLSLCPC
jgi:hypothetical protein